MSSRAVSAIFLSALLSVLPACTERTDEPGVAATEAASSEAAEAISAVPADSASDIPQAAAATNLDVGALNEKQDPERLLRFYTDAVRAGDWKLASLAWGLDAQMNPAKLESRYGNPAGVKLAVGKGDMGGAAGTLYYEAPVVIDYGDGRPSRRGTIVLRRVNDVPGASPEQLVWRIERSSTVAY